MSKTYEIVSYIIQGIQRGHYIRHSMSLPRQLTFFEEFSALRSELPKGFVKNCNRKNIELEKYLLNKKAGNEALN